MLRCCLHMTRVRSRVILGEVFFSLLSETRMKDGGGFLSRLVLLWCPDTEGVLARGRGEEEEGKIVRDEYC